MFGQMRGSRRRRASGPVSSQGTQPSALQEIVLINVLLGTLVLILFMVVFITTRDPESAYTTFCAGNFAGADYRKERRQHSWGSTYSVATTAIKFADERTCVVSQWLSLPYPAGTDIIIECSSWSGRCRLRTKA